VQSTGDICSLYDGIYARGAEHRDIGYLFKYSGALHLMSFYPLFCYKYFAALPLSDNQIFDIFQIFSFIN